MQSEESASDIVVLDVTGLQCPLPVLKAQKALRDLESGALLQVISTDPMAKIDIPHFCQEHGHTLREQYAREEDTIYILQKK